LGVLLENRERRWGVYACTAATEEGARCRNFVETPGEFCGFHKTRKEAGGEVSFAPKPDLVLLKFNLNPNWRERFVALGVAEKPLLSPEKEKEHVQQAEKFGRQAYRFRQIADSGVPVFGSEGITSGVSLYKLLKEFLETEGYQVTDIHLRPRRDKRMYVLVINLSQQGEETVLSSEAIMELLRFLAVSCWGYCHVWANPPAEDGRVIHTVNSSHREPEKKPSVELRFNNGLWAVVEPT